MFFHWRMANGFEFCGKKRFVDMMPPHCVGNLLALGRIPNLDVSFLHFLAGVHQGEPFVDHGVLFQ